MKKMFVSLLAAMMLCTGLSLFTFAATNDSDPNNQPPVEENVSVPDEKPSQNGSKENKTKPSDCVNGHEEDGN